MIPDTVDGRTDAGPGGYRRILDGPDRRRAEGTDSRTLQRKGVSGRPDAAPAGRILVLGIGNVLMGDESVGARVVEALQDSFEFSGNVEMMQDWTLGSGLLDAVLDADLVVVVEALRAGGVPGGLYRLSDGELGRSLPGDGSPHEIALAETLAAAEILGWRPKAVVLGVEPEDTAGGSPWLTEQVERRVPDLVTAALKEIGQMGCGYRRKTAGNGPRDARRSAVV